MSRIYFHFSVYKSRSAKMYLLCVNTSHRWWLSVASKGCFYKGQTTTSQPSYWFQGDADYKTETSPLYLYRYMGLESAYLLHSYFIKNT